MANIRDPQYGIKKDALTLTSQDPNAVMYGVTPDNKFIPIKVSATGEIMLGGTITLEPGDIQIGAVELKNHDTDDRVYVSPQNALRVDSRTHDGIGTAITSTAGGVGKQGLDVNVIGGGSVGISDNDDDSIAANQNIPLSIPLLYAYDGSTNWNRLHQTSGALHTRLYAGTSALSATGNSLDVNITGGAASGPTDTDDGSVAGSQSAALGIGLNYGWNGSNWERLNSTSNRLLVDGSGVTQPISVSSLPLPAGASTETTLNSLLTAFNAEDFATETTLASINGKIMAVDTGNVSVVSSVLPTGAATEATLLSLDGKDFATETTLNSLLTAFNAEDFATETTLSSIDTNIDVALSTRASELTLSGVKTQTDKLTFTGTSLDVNITGGASSGPTDTDDGSVAGSQSASLGIGLQYGWNGSNWERINSTSNRLQVDGSGVTQPTDLIDNTSRELGRISASDIVYISEICNTTDNFSNIRPTNGDINCRHYKAKTVSVTNTGVNDAKVNILGSINNGVSFRIVLAKNAKIVPGNTLDASSDKALTHIRIEAKADVSGSQTTLISEAYAIGD